MAKKQSKILKGAKEAVAFARGTCTHQWIYKRSKDPRKGMVKHCRKCGVRLTTWGD